MIGKLYLWMKDNLLNRSAKPYLLFLFFYLLIAYWVVNVHFFKSMGLRVVSWHTHIAFPLTVGFVGWMVIKMLWPLYNWNQGKAICKWFFLIGTYTLVELIIMATGLAKIVNENASGHYAACLETDNASYYHVWEPHSSHLLSSNEFQYERMTNSLGFSDREWEKNKKKGTFRIICLGDSFTEGDGAHVDSSYVAFLSRKMKQVSDKIEVMNAGTCGSDPYFNFVNLRDRLSNYKPDLIIQTLSSFDLLFDIPLRGGMERFLENKKLQYTPPPWWEPLYAVSYIFRIFINVSGYNPNLTRNDNIMANLDKYVTELVSMINKRFAPLARENSCKILLLYLPMKGEVEKSSDDVVRRKINVRTFDFDITYRDLLPCYERQISDMGDSIDDFYWKYDSHHNHKGYEMMAECIFSFTIPLLPDSIISYRQ